jgi:hypothetical protein
VFEKDNIRPVLVGFSLDMNDGFLYVTFSETVDPTSFVMDQFVIQNLANASAANRVALSASSVPTSNTPDKQITVKLSQGDLDSIKLGLVIARSNESTFLTLTSNALTDMETNPVVAIENGAGLPVSDYTADNRRPELVSVHFNLNTGRLTLGFSEIVNATSLQVPEITMQDAALAFRTMPNMPPLNQHKLVAGTALPTNAETVVILLSELDLDHVKRLSGLATASVNTWVSITENAIADLAGNKVIPQLDGFAIPHSPAPVFVEDMTRPVLERFDFLMSPEGPPATLRLYFSETMDAGSFDSTKVQLQDEQVYNMGTTSRFRLTNPASVDPVPLPDN